MRRYILLAVTSVSVLAGNIATINQCGDDYATAYTNDFYNYGCYAEGNAYQKRTPTQDGKGVGVELFTGAGCTGCSGGYRIEGPSTCPYGDECGGGTNNETITHYDFGSEDTFIDFFSDSACTQSYTAQTKPYHGIVVKKSKYGVCNSGIRVTKDYATGNLKVAAYFDGKRGCTGTELAGGYTFTNACQQTPNANMWHKYVDPPIQQAPSPTPAANAPTAGPAMSWPDCVSANCPAGLTIPWSAACQGTVDVAGCKAWYGTDPTYEAAIDCLCQKCSTIPGFIKSGLAPVCPNGVSGCGTSTGGPSASSADADSDGLAPGAIAGIVLGALAGVALVVAVFVALAAVAVVVIIVILKKGGGDPTEKVVDLPAVVVQGHVVTNSSNALEQQPRTSATAVQMI
jgi:hypothetical protein